MKQKMKRYLAAVLSFAMVLTLLPSVGAKAADDGAAVTINCSKIVASGNQSSTTEYLIATNHCGKDGNDSAAAFVEGETGSSAEGNLGSARMAGMAFQLSAAGALDADSISKATVTVNVTGVNQNLGERFTKAGLFRVDSDCYDAMSTDAATFPATGGKYDYASTVYSNEQIAKTDLGKKTFDVTDWVKDAVAKNESSIIFRIQTVISGFIISAAGEDAPVLTIESAGSISDTAAVANAKAALTIPTTVKEDITLPSTGLNGAAIAWKSGDAAVITDAGVVTRSDADKKVTLTATISKGTVSDTKAFEVTVSKKYADDLLASYAFEEAEGKITAKDTTGNGFDGTVKGVGAKVTNGTLTLPGGNHASSAVDNYTGPAYVELPGKLFAEEDTLTISIWLKDEIDNNDYAAMFFGTKTKHVDSASTANFPVNYWLLNPSKGGMFKSVWTNGSNADGPWSTETAVSSEKTSNDWSLYTTVITPNRIIGYYNGEEVSNSEKTLTTTDFGSDLVAYIGRSSYADTFYKGGVYGLKVYEKALSQDEIYQEYYEAYPSAVMEQKALFETTAAKLEKVMLNENTSADSVVKELSFPEELNKVQLTWTPADETIVKKNGNKGEIVYEGKEAAATTIHVNGTFTDSKGNVVNNAISKDIAIKVESMAQKDFAAFKEDGSITIANADNITGNITLPGSGTYGTRITWTSEPSADGIITLEEEAVEGYDSKPAGIVTRGTEDKNLKLTASMTVGGETATKTFDITVKAKDEETKKPVTEDTLTDYVMAYFVGNGAGEEQIYFATSRDGVNWEELNNTEPILVSTLGEKGVRDPFIIRSAEGDKFYLIATDLCMSNRNQDWSGCQTEGSQSIMVWESSDLVNWSDQRMVEISADINAGCTWAPEIFYDEKTAEYLVFWASKTADDNFAKQRVYYAKTRDFYSFTTPKVWIDESHSAIDSTVAQDDDGTYYRFTKNESQTYVYMEKADSLLGKWTKVVDKVAGGVEGPCCFKYNKDDRETVGATWCLLLDDFGGVGYYPMVTDSLSGENVTFTKKDANLPKAKKPRHGTVMRITSEEYSALMSAYGEPSLAEGSIPGYVTTNYKLPETIDIVFAGETKNVPVTWENADFSKVGTVTVKGSIPSMNDAVVTKTIEVVSDKLIYFIDSGVGGNNESMPTSKAYEQIAAIEGIKLRNEVADKAYEKGSWGYTGKVGTADEVNTDKVADIGLRASTDSSIYSNGWWAGSDKPCEYAVNLESGTYTATGYFGEWWSQNRDMAFYIQYTNDSGYTYTSKKENFTISGSEANKAVTVNFKVTNVADKAEVHLIAVGTGSAAPVIAGVSIEKLEDGAAKEAARGDAIKAIDAITVTPMEKSLYVNDTEQITINYPKDLAAKLEAAGIEEAESAKYKTSDTSVATVSKDGLIRAKKAGTVTITTTITYDDGTKKELTTAITVQAKSEQKPDSTPDQKPDSTPDQKPNPTPDQTPGTGNQPTGDNGQATVETTIALDEVKLVLGEKETYALKATVTEADGQKVTWQTSKKSVATVSSNGKITARKAGTANITATVNGKTATCKVTVKAAPKKITLNAKSKSIKKGKTFQIKVKLPKNTASNKITYTSSKKSVATVSSSGKVKAKKKGKATITVKTFNGKKARLKITVK